MVTNIVFYFYWLLGLFSWIKYWFYSLKFSFEDNYSEKFVYRVRQLDCLKSKANEEERIQEINKQIDSLQNIKQVDLIFKVKCSYFRIKYWLILNKDNQQRIGSSLATYVKGESWFTRFMRLANAIYTHRMSNGGKIFENWSLKTTNNWFYFLNR